MKRLLSLVLCLSLLMTCGAFALNYTPIIESEATFETMAEVQQNAPAALQPYLTRGTYVIHPAMEDYPVDNTFVYRSADKYGRNAAVRLNTTLLIYTDKSFETKDDAFTYLKDMGAIDIIDRVKGSVILVTPTDPAKGFQAADQMNYYKLQTALFSINATGWVDGQYVTYVDASYYGTYGLLYVVGIDGGATFLNNYVAGTVDFLSRIAGMLLVGGGMDRIRKVSTFLPVYLVNATDAVKAKYEAANDVNAISRAYDKITSYNQQYPLRKVVKLDTEEVDLKAILEDAYYNMFAWAQRGQEICVGLESAGTPYQGYGADTVPYSLSARNPVYDGKTLDGIYVIPHVEERFADLKTVSGEYLQYWVEYLPEEIVDGTAADGSIPLILLQHGGGDDPHQFADGQNFLDLAGRERIAMVAPEKNSLHANTENGVDFLSQAMPRLVQYMLDTYPAIDASRVYVTGYSMGSTATCRSANGAPWLFAAAYPQNGFGATSNNPTEADIARFEGIQLPIVCSTTEYNYGKYETIDATNIGAFNAYLMLNHMDPLPEEIDYSVDPILGIKTDLYTQVTLNDDYKQHTWYQCNEDGIPMVGLNYVECINHCLYPQYADMIWDFFKHYSRNQETLEIEYDPYVR